KSEIQNSKSETIAKNQKTKFRKRAFSLRQFWIFGFDHWDLFRISSFEFRVSDLKKTSPIFPGDARLPFAPPPLCPLCYDPRTHIIMDGRHTFGLFLLTLALGMGFQSRRPASVGTTPAAKGQNEKIRFVDVAAQSG